MNFLRSAGRLLLALVVFAAIAQVKANAQIPPGTTRNGTFVWDGARWLPVEQPPPPPPQGFGGIEITVNDAPPPLPVYEQPPCPEPNLLWTPGYWHHGLFGFYWVPGAWVPAPYVGALWTPGYWGFAGGGYGFHAGYWGPHIGFYGGVNYGGGFMGIGFAGGSWNGGVFAYNTAVVNVNRTVITNVYVNTTIVQQTTIVNNSHTSFNGGPNGVQHQATPDEQVAAHDTHTAPTTFQQQHVTAAAADKSNLASNNGGHPTNLAVAKPLAAEAHAAPAGFRPPPARPVTELAHAQAPPATIAAAKTATAKTVTVAASAPKTPAKAPAMAAKPPAPAASAPPAKTPVKSETMAAPKTTPPPAKVAPKPEFTPAPKSTTPPPAKVAPKVEPKAPPKPPAKATKPPAKNEKEKPQG